MTRVFFIQNLFTFLCVFITFFHKLREKSVSVLYTLVAGASLKRKTNKSTLQHILVGVCNSLRAHLSAGVSRCACVMCMCSAAPDNSHVTVLSQLCVPPQVQQGQAGAVATDHPAHGRRRRQWRHLPRLRPRLLGLQPAGAVAESEPAAGAGAGDGGGGAAAVPGVAHVLRSPAQRSALTTPAPRQLPSVCNASFMEMQG